MSIYKHVFWDVSGVPTPVSTTDTTELRNIASRVQTDYSTDVIFGLFDTGTDGNSARLSFVIIVKKKTSDEVNTIIDKLHKDIKDRLDADTAFQNAGYTVDAILKVEARVHFFDDKQDAYVQGYQESYSLEKALALHKTFESRCAPRAASNLHLPIRGTEAFQVSADQSGQAFSISSSKFTALQSATKDDLQADIAELQKAFSDLSEETKGPVAAVIMATKGFVTIGKEMWDKYKDIIKTKTSDSDIIDLTPELLIGIISAAGVGTVIAAIAGLAAAIGVAAVVFKE